MEMPLSKKDIFAAWEGDLPVLKGSQLFAGIRESEILPMMNCTGAYRKKFRRGEAIIVTEDTVPCAGLILSGTVQMVQEDVWGVRTILMSLGEGEFFGESFACGTQLHATVSFEAQTEVTTVYFPFRRMLTMCGSACAFHQRLIENIFFKNSPLHDGAMVISNKRIMSAGCILPVSHNLDIPKELGLRHRAALGISQSSDAIAVIVSEETGRISVAIKGEFRLRLSAEELESILTQEMM